LAVAGGLTWWTGRAPPPRGDSDAPSVANARAVVGLWSRWPEATSEQDPVRFWFFHEDGIGLYRYGQVGLNTTNSFDWQQSGDTLTLVFRKTGQRAQSRVEVADGVLRLMDDPREPFADEPVPYRFVPAPVAAAAPDLGAFVDENYAPSGKKGEVPGRLWMDAQKFATGGMGFSLYQLRDVGIDGRGAGWFHHGDFDDWSTEALFYRYSTARPPKGPGALELWFVVRGERALTATLHDPAGSWTLKEDPRGYGQAHRYLDAGNSFGAVP
jgi:hypothetical protein